MAAVLSPEVEDSLVSQFLEIAAAQSTTTARRYLHVTGWNLEDALQLFFGGQDGWNPTSELNNIWSDYQDPAYSEMEVEQENFKRTDGLVAGEGAMETKNNDGSSSGQRMGDNKLDSAADGTRVNNLASLFRPPLNLMFQGDFEQAKGVAKEENRWLIVNVQSDREFNSHMLNRDTWAEETIAVIIDAYFVFWQVQDDTGWGKKVSNYYNIDSFPAIMVIDPITGQKLASWTGMIQPESLIDNLQSFMARSPLEHLSSLVHKRSTRVSPQAHEPQHNEEDRDLHDEEDEDLERALTFSMEGLSTGEVGGQETEETSKMPSYPPLPEEPKGDRSLLCRVGIRLPPNGRRIQRNFLLSDPIQLLWSFCFSELDVEARTRPFKITQAIPGGSKCLKYGTSLTFKESGLANTMISVTLE